MVERYIPLKYTWRAMSHAILCTSVSLNVLSYLIQTHGYSANTRHISHVTKNQK
jgi:hypothetical protein